MSNTLIIAGETYNDVTGIKVTDSSLVTQTYIQPSGTKQITALASGSTFEDVAAYASAEINVASSIGTPITVTGTNLVEFTTTSDPRQVSNFTITIPYDANGISQVVLTRAGKNLFPTTWPQYSFAATMGNSGISDASTQKLFSIRCKANTYYRFYLNQGFSWLIGFTNVEPRKSGDYLAEYKGNMTNRVPNASWSSGNNTYLVMAANTTSYKSAVNLGVQVTEGTEVYDYEDWTGDEWVIDFPNHIYGGTVDVLNGTVTATVNSANQTLATPIVYNIDKIYPIIKDGYNRFTVNLLSASLSVTYVPVYNEVATITSQLTSTLDNVMKGYEGFKNIARNVPNRSLAGNYVDGNMDQVLNRGFYGITGLTSIHLSNVTTVGSQAFYGCTGLVTAVLEKITSFSSTNAFAGCTKLASVDLYKPATIQSNTFNASTALSTLVIRNTSVTTLADINAFSGTCFKSDGTGGTLYVPEALISDYESASNWVTILGYANNSIQKIEGSQYENYYVDGTPVTYKETT